MQTQESANTLSDFIIRESFFPMRRRQDISWDFFGLQEDYQGHVNAYDSNLLFTKHDATVGAYEFILPLSGVLTEFNKGKGGIAHVAFEVDDIEACSEELKAMGIEMLEAKAVEGTEEIIVNFIRPKYTDGILVELIQTIGPINYDFKF